MNESWRGFARVACTALLLLGCDTEGGGGTGADVGAAADTAPAPDSAAGEDAAPDAGGVPATVPDFAAATFSDPTRIDNPLHPLVPGVARIYQEATPEDPETVVVETLAETRAVAGVTARVVRDRVYVYGLLIEDTHDWFAQDDEGNVWYLGEEVDNYEYDDEGQVLGVDHEGAWEAGEDVAETGEEARPGYAMPAAPVVGAVYHQEYYPGEAEDMGEIAALEVPVTLSDGWEYTCLRTRDFTPHEPGLDEHKYYAPGVGVVRENGDATPLDLLAVIDTGPASLPDFAAATFSDPTRIDNPYLPLTPGATWTYDADTEDGHETAVFEVLADTREVAGVLCVVVNDRVWLDGVLIEDTHDWFAQDDDGNVWYMGETVDNYTYDDEGQLIAVTHEGAWEAGADVAGTGTDALPGHALPADPVARTSYRQEYYPGAAEDIAFVARVDAAVELGDGATYEGCLRTLDWVPLEPDAIEYKYYAPGIGLVLETAGNGTERLELTSFEPGP